jgi:N-acyl-D-amino-acid deacylase
MKLVSAITLGSAAAAGAAFLFAQQPPQYDVVFRNGRVIDGTGNPAFHADVAIKEGRIRKIGRVDGKGREEIDAKGMVVTPGFIDVHTHAENVLDMPEAENYVRMGVTTLVVGNCGGSEDNLATFFKRLETDRRPSVNVASLVGHNTVRRAAMGGNFDRPPTLVEMGKMKASVDKAMRDGAVGFSTGLIYMPGTFSKTPEIVELAKVASKYGGIYTSHMRSEGLKIFEAMNEVFTVAREAKMPAEISHIKLSGNAMWGNGEKVLAAIEKARAQGLDITQDQYVYTASSTSISQLIPDFALEGGKASFEYRLKDPEIRKRITEEMRAMLTRNGRKEYTYAVIASYNADRSLNGKRIPEAARLKKGSDSLENQIELIIEIQQKGGASGVFHGINEDDLQLFLKHPHTMVASDGSIRKFGESVPHPRSYGNNARAIQRYVNELKIVRLEDMIRRMTSLPANTFRLKDRGVLREGAWADIVVFDPDKVRENTTYEKPHAYATGFSHLFVNGVKVLGPKGHTGRKPGKALRRAAS